MFFHEQVDKKSRICPLDPPGGGRYFLSAACTGKLRPKGQETHEGR